MKATELIAKVESALAEVKATGASQVQIEPLLDYLRSIGAGASEAEAAEVWNRERWKLLAPLEHQGRIEHYRSVLESGQTALKTFSTINGGAALAILAFIGNLLPKELPPGTPNPIPALSVAMLAFFVGVALTGFSSGLRYLTQLLGNGRSPRGANVSMYAAIIAGGGSPLAFVWGLLQAYWAFR